MNRVVLLAFLCTAMSSYCKACSWPHNHRSTTLHEMPVRRLFEGLAKKVIYGEEAYNSHCNAVSKNVQEMYTDDSYILIYSPGFAATDVTLQVKHRMINTIIKGNGQEFNDVRILPDILNAAQAGWYFEGQKVKVVIPYRISLNVIKPVTCLDINKETVTIQQSPDLENMDVYRQGNGGRFGSNFNPNIRNVKNY